MRIFNILPSIKNLPYHVNKTNNIIITSDFLLLQTETSYMTFLMIFLQIEYCIIFFWINVSHKTSIISLIKTGLNYMKTTTDDDSPDHQLSTNNHKETAKSMFGNNFNLR